MNSAQPPNFSSPSEYARLLFTEASRHFRDGFILHRHRRYAGAITSASKAVELGFNMPGTYYSHADSAKHLRTARDVLIALQSVYPEIQAWKISL
jgi:hypothetical protein